MPRRVLLDWTPGADQSEEDWLADQYDHGWVPDHYYGAAPATVSIDGHPPVHRWAMVEIPAGENQPPASY